MEYEPSNSPITGIRKKGTTFKELQTLFIDKISTKYIYEPIFSCKKAEESSIVKEKLKHREFDIVGVINKNTQIIGFAKREELTEGPIENFTKKIEIQNVISDSTPISGLLNILSDKPFVFVLVKENINGIITIADINKPIVRIYLFGIISLFEMHINYWIKKYYQNESWREILKKERLNKAKELHELRKGKNEDLSLLECLQLSDKKVILQSAIKFLEKFKYSKNYFKKLLEDIEKIRNELAHSQKSITSNIDWKDFVNTILRAENFLCKSEKTVEETSQTPNKGT